jgi:hypothetical protein
MCTAIQMAQQASLEYDALVTIGEMLYRLKIIPAPPVSQKETERLRDKELKEKTDDRARMARLMEEIKSGTYPAGVRHLLDLNKN